MRTVLVRLGFLLLAALGPSTGSLAQGSEDMSSRAQTNRTGLRHGAEGTPQAQVAQVGAGTTNGSTTGFSGPDSGGTSPGLTELPPVPSAEQCQRYQNTPAYRGCLWVVLGQKPTEP